MIRENNLKDLLESIGFVESGNIFKKEFPFVNATMSVSFETKKLYFPEQIRGRERNDGFDKPENFVVFECVNRLLEKGYRPESIELEREWPLGHTPVGGRGDICVSDKNNSETLFIIECKTWDREFVKTYNDTKKDGAQLFSYWQQEQACKWLILYESDICDNGVNYRCKTISCSDDSNILDLAKKDKTIKLYRDAKTAPDKHIVWRDTYNLVAYDDLVFSDDSVAYDIGVKPLRKKNLREFTPDDGIVNQFEEILRHNNVSDRENAFNRLVALFICKLVDESTKNDDDEVEFQYKHGTDTYESLQDRLQKLYHIGMERFMQEKIYYVPTDYPKTLFQDYTGQVREKAAEDLRKTIRILKFYSNNDFAFKDVHNEELFYQNGKIIVEMVQLFQEYKIVYHSRHQFLGKMFEELLNNGFKQNEGQFFTPGPITRFIWDSLPVSNTVKPEEGIYPKVIDYACGAGHFLTEAVEAINFYAGESGDNSWVKDCVYGIEKDYRLARVSKISLFMNGAGDGNIIFGDGLENALDKGIENGSFDILVSNPPYSVRDFKQHLKLKNNTFRILDSVGAGGEIETLFVERIGQLLKPGGIAAVILPVSIMNKENQSYVGAREEILRNFFIRAIVSLGGNAFGATGTSTVIMFLQKYCTSIESNSSLSDFIRNIFSGDIDEMSDKDIFESYLRQNKIECDFYESFLKKECSADELKENAYFSEYADLYSDLLELNDSSNFFDCVAKIESEKLFYFYLVSKQKTILITTPETNEERKDFLGYSVNKESITILHPGGKMYDDSNRVAEGTLACAVRNFYDDVLPSFTDEQLKYASVVQTKDIIDFSSPDFKKIISITPDTEFHSRHEMVKLSSIAEIIAGQSPKSEFYNTVGDGFPFFQGKKEFSAKYLGAPSVWTTHLTKKAVRNDILMSVRAPVGDVNINSHDEICIGRGLAAIRAKSDNVRQEYIFYFLKVNEENISGHNGLAFDSISRSEVEKIKIPLPSVERQLEVIAECKKVDEEYERTRMSAKAYREKINKVFIKMEVISS